MTTINFVERCESSANTIDLIFAKRVDNIIASGVVHIGISDHSLLAMSYESFRFLKTRPIIKDMRNFKKFLEDELINWFYGQNLEPFDDPNLAWRAWKFDFNAILDLHTPIRHMRETIINTVSHI